VLVTGIQQRRVCGAEEPFQPKDLVWLDSCDKHRNEEEERLQSSERFPQRRCADKPTRVAAAVMNSNFVRPLGRTALKAAAAFLP